MPLNIKDPETHNLAKELAAITGESLTEAVRQAVRDRLRRERALRAKRPLADRLDEIALRVASLPVLDDRSPDEILGYDDKGTWL